MAQQPSTLNILIADDHEIVRRGLRSLLSTEFPGAQIAEAGDARETAALLARQSWDLLLLDINMPGRSGLEVLHDVKRLCPRTPVLVLSVNPEAEFALRALKLGAAAYLNKQSDAAELLAALRKILAGGKYLTAKLAQQLADTLGEDLQQEPHQALSNRELEVLRLIAAGQTLKEIAATLALSETTIGTYRARLAHKMGLSTNVELTRYALQHKLAE
jgi:DNA-binding NarL/FixJ family response regulator